MYVENAEFFPLKVWKLKYGNKGCQFLAITFPLQKRSNQIKHNTKPLTLDRIVTKITFILTSHT
jgi:hypothetical protein